MTTRTQEEQTTEEKYYNDPEAQEAYQEGIKYGEQRYIDTQKLICMRCGAWDAVNNRPNDAKCGVNCAILTKEKTQGFNCKLQRYQRNLLAGSGL